LIQTSFGSERSRGSADEAFGMIAICGIEN
jgi:hypothetical protein